MIHQVHEAHQERPSQQMAEARLAGPRKSVPHKARRQGSATTNEGQGLGLTSRVPRATRCLPNPANSTEHCGPRTMTCDPRTQSPRSFVSFVGDRIPRCGSSDGCSPSSSRRKRLCYSVARSGFREQGARHRGRAPCRAGSVSSRSVGTGRRRIPLDLTGTDSTALPDIACSSAAKRTGCLRTKRRAPYTPCRCSIAR
jgi:hypothetical protein